MIILANLSWPCGVECGVQTIVGCLVNRAAKSPLGDCMAAFSHIKFELDAFETGKLAVCERVVADDDCGKAVEGDGAAR